MIASTIPGLLLERNATSPNAVAMRFARHGKWNEVTVGALKQRAAAIGAGLAARGVKPGDVVAVVAEDGPLGVAAEIGAQGIGATVLAIASSSPAESVCAAIAASSAVCVVAGDQEQFDKVDESRGSVPSVRFVAVGATRGMRQIEDANHSNRDWVVSLANLETEGDAASWDATVANVSATHAARMAAGAAVTHAQLLASADRLQSSFGVVASDVLCVLGSIADPVDHALVVAGPLRSGAVVHFRGRLATMQALRQVQPSVVHATSGWVSRLHADVESHRERAKGIKAMALRSGLKSPSAAPTMLTKKRPNTLRAVGIATVIVELLFLMFSTKLHDAARIVVMLAILAVALAVIVMSGLAVPGPLRRRYGLSRCRAVLDSSGGTLEGASVLASLGVPFVNVPQEATS